jgi:hypothetical protein
MCFALKQKATTHDDHMWWKSEANGRNKSSRRQIAGGFSHEQFIMLEREINQKRQRRKRLP